MVKKREAYIFDLDGTVCDERHRNKFAIAKDWDNYHRLLDGDLPIEQVVKIMHTLNESAWIILLTARPEKYREMTLAWIDKHGIPCQELHMRPDGDYRTSPELKLEIFTQRIEPEYDVIAVFEDRLDVVKMWRDNAIHCYQTEV